MPLRQVIFSLFLSVTLLVFVVELVRRRKLREEFAWLWLLAAVSGPGIVIGFPLIRKFTRLIGADEPVSIVYLFTLLFLVVVDIFYSIKISQLTEQVKDLAQALAVAMADKPDADDTEE